MEAIIIIVLFNMINTSTIPEKEIELSPMERVQKAFPGIDFEDQCWILYQQPTTKRKYEK